jgi:hypothetical protein
MAKKVEANPMKRDQAEQGRKRKYAFQKAPRGTAKSKRTGELARLPPCVDGMFAVSMVLEAEPQRVRRMVPGSMDTTASRRGWSVSS